MNELAKEILDTVEVGALATVNVDRTPLVTPLHFARLGDSIVWISEPTEGGASLRAIQKMRFETVRRNLWFGMIKSEQFS